MAVELEQTIMADIGLGAHYNWFNGSGSCESIRRKAVEVLTEAAEIHGLTISQEWLNHCRKAYRADAIEGGRYTLTKTWVSCSYAIEDAIYRKEGGKDAGFSPKTLRI